MIRITLTLLAACVLSACAHVNQESAIYSPSVLNGSREKFHRKIVRVRGYVTITSNGHTLYESKSLNAEFRRLWDQESDFDQETFDKYCLTIANPDFFYKNSELLSGKTIIAEGRFIKNYLKDDAIDLGACPIKTGIIIDTKSIKTVEP